MAAVSSQARLIIGDENLEVRQKKVAFDGKTMNSKVAAKKGKEGVARKPLGDLTNKKGIHVEVTTKKPTAPKDKFNITEEGFLHNHSKCVEANNAALKLSLLDLLLPKCDMVFSDRKDLVPAKPQVEFDSSPFIEEMEILDLSQFDSPPPLHKRFDSPPSSPFAWRFEPVEFALKDEN